LGVVAGSRETTGYGQKKKQDGTTP
jgi:hypothetical protein